MGRDLGFITRFWMSMTKFFDIMNSFMITEINKTQWFYQWICDTQIMWKLFYVILLRIIVLSSFTAQKMKFSTKDFFSKCDQIRNGKLRFCAVFEHWIMLIVFIYLVLILSVWLTIKPNNLRKFILEFLKKKTWSNLHLRAGGPMTVSTIHACLSICLWHIFLKIYSVDFLNFLDENILSY